MPDFAIIIPAYNEESFLRDTLACARKAMDQIEKSGELIVVDNNSTDATAEVASAAGADLVVFEPHNQIARARNAGARATGAFHLIFVDADTSISAELLELALGHLESNKVAAGGAQVVMDQPVSPIVRWLVTTWNGVATVFRYGAGSFFFCRRDAFEETGGFDESVYAGEEVWLARRVKRWARRHRMRFLVIPEPPVLTSGRKSDWFSTGDFVRQLAILFLIPWATRSRRLCGLWYHRPAENRGE